MFDTVIEMLSYPFMTRAFLVGSLVALCSALLGVSLVLKRYSMIGDGLSHVGFGAMAIAAAMNAAPLTVAIPVVIVAAILLLRISGNAKIKGDAAIALISTTSLAVGVMVISLTTGMRMMGALLISSLIIFPALTSMRVCRTFKSVIINAAVISVVCLIAGVTLSYVAATPAGASVVLANLVMMVLYTVVGAVKNHMR